MIRFAFRGLLIVSSLVLVVQAASAQGTAADISTSIELEGHPKGHEIELPENGQTVLPIIVKMSAGNFTCLQETKVTFEVSSEKDPQYAYPAWGAGVVNPAPTSVTFTIPVGDPGPSGSKSYAADKKLNFELEWNVDERPPTGAKWTYKITTDKPSFEPQGLCQPAPPAPTHGFLLVTATMPDKPLNGTTGDCALAPDLPECQTTQGPAEAEDSPGFDVAMFITGTIGLVYAFRRKLA